MRSVVGITMLVAALGSAGAAEQRLRDDSPLSSDYAREKKWADEITPGLVVGEPVYLEQKNGHRFLALYTATKNAKGAVLIAHGRGTHPDWGLNGVLRVALADAGYTTLSVQMPVLDAGGKLEAYLHLFPEAIERLGLAAHFLEAAGYKRIGLVSHSLGARMSNEFLAGHPPASVKAWVSIGIINGMQDMQWVKVPVLDVFGEKDWDGVLNGAGDRAKEMRKIFGSRQLRVAGADHFFEGREPELIKAVREFLDQRLAQH